MTRRHEERRVRPRIPMSGDVVVDRDGERFVCSARDLSSTGVGMLCPAAGLRGGRVHVELALGNGSEWLVLDGVQVREERQGRGFVWGVRFHRLEPRASARLVAHVRGEVVKANQAAGRHGPKQARGARPGAQTWRDVLRAALHSLK